MSTNERARPILADDRGAIMVMGIFMCSCLVGALWYLAGIGDAILYRERMQEAADAIAFSDAALHARGMNLIVLINLVMAVILSVRVALRVGKLACTVAALVFTALGFLQPELWALAAPCSAAAQTLDTVDQTTKAPIDGALRALVVTQDGISQSAPILARAAATAVGESYVGRKGASPPVSTIRLHTAFRVSDPLSDFGGLPVEHARPKKLCDEAGAALKLTLEWVLGKASGGVLKPAGTVIGGFAMALVSTSSSYFCDLEGGASPPNTDALFKEGAKATCKDPSKVAGKEQEHFDKAERAWLDECAALGVTCQSRDPKGDPLLRGVQAGQPGGPESKKKQDRLERLRLERDQGVASIVSLAERQARLAGGGALDQQQCEEWAMGDTKQREGQNDALTKQQGGGKGGDNGTSQGTSGVAPMAVKDLRNGSAEGQFIGGVLGDPARLRKDARLVRIGTFNAKQTPQMVDPEGAELPAWAQAEIFYDCADTWTGGKTDTCNADDDAMWHFMWRPRLRRFNQPVGDTLQTLAAKMGFRPPRRGPEEFADKLARDALAPARGGEFKSNAALRKNLSELASDQTTREHGVH